jgi:hypothetical protein
MRASAYVSSVASVVSGSTCRCSRAGSRSASETNGTPPRLRSPVRRRKTWLPLAGCSHCCPPRSLDSLMTAPPQRTHARSHSEVRAHRAAHMADHLGECVRRPGARRFLGSIALRRKLGNETGSVSRAARTRGFGRSLPALGRHAAVFWFLFAPAALFVAVSVFVPETPLRDSGERVVGAWASGTLVRRTAARTLVAAQALAAPRSRRHARRACRDGCDSWSDDPPPPAGRSERDRARRVLIHPGGQARAGDAAAAACKTARR